MGRRCCFNRLVKKCPQGILAQTRKSQACNERVSENCTFPDLSRRKLARVRAGTRTEGLQQGVKKEKKQFSEAG